MIGLFSNVVRFMGSDCCQRDKSKDEEQNGQKPQQLYQNNSSYIPFNSEIGQNRSSGPYLSKNAMEYQQQQQFQDQQHFQYVENQSHSNINQNVMEQEDAGIFLEHQNEIIQNTKDDQYSNEINIPLSQQNNINQYNNQFYQNNASGSNSNKNNNNDNNSMKVKEVYRNKKNSGNNQMIQQNNNSNSSSNPHQLMNPSSKGKSSKKGQKNWNQEEDSLLRMAYNKFPGKWNVIAEQVGTRTAQQCQMRYKKTQPKNPNRKIWTLEEDQIVKQMVTHGDEKERQWGYIAQQLGNERTGKQVRERFLNVLDDTINKGKWVQEEDTIIVSKLYEIGPKWSEISKFLQGRPENMVKNRFYSHIKRTLNHGIHQDYTNEFQQEFNEPGSTADYSMNTNSEMNIEQQNKYIQKQQQQQQQKQQQQNNNNIQQQQQQQQNSVQNGQQQQFQNNIQQQQQSYSNNNNRLQQNGSGGVYQNGSQQNQQFQQQQQQQNGMQQEQELIDRTKMYSIQNDIEQEQEYPDIKLESQDSQKQFMHLQGQQVGENIIHPQNLQNGTSNIISQNYLGENNQQISNNNSSFYNNALVSNGQQQNQNLNNNNNNNIQNNNSSSNCNNGQHVQQQINQNNNSLLENINVTNNSFEDDNMYLGINRPEPSPPKHLKNFKLSGSVSSESWKQGLEQQQGEEVLQSSFLEPKSTDDQKVINDLMLQIERTKQSNNKETLQKLFYKLDNIVRTLESGMNIKQEDN